MHAKTCQTLHAGFFFGRTPLIKLSPKKTWEGFSGGLVLTVVSSWYLAEFMSRYKWMICPRTVSLRLMVSQPRYALAPAERALQHFQLPSCKPQGTSCHAVVRALKSVLALNSEGCALCWTGLTGNMVTSCRICRWAGWTAIRTSCSCQHGSQ